ncbi:MAG: glycosyltransferase [Lachnospiraceae bacterium]|nr:glycosyltransferase [Lachnospiraceae bacterium]
MEILFYRYGSICEPDIIKCFRSMELEVVEENSQVTNKKVSPSETVAAVSELIKKHSFLFVFTINFFPAVSDICQIYKMPYVCWTVDCPVMELFSPALANDCNRVFMFDKAQYEYFRHINPKRIFHLPLATNVSRWDQVISQASSRDLDRFTSDISFIGSLYEEKDPYDKIQGLSEYTKGYVEGMIEAQLQVYGYNMLEDLLNVYPDNPAILPGSFSSNGLHNTNNQESSLSPIMQDFKKHVPDLTRSPYAPYFSPSYIIAHHFIGMHAAVVERRRLLSMLSENHAVDLYTFSDTSHLPKVHNRGGAKTLTEMPLIFHQSRINLNMTIRPIQTGLSLRIFDILGCGGFLLTNYQQELGELYEIGKDVEVFTSKEELADKAAYYLTHDEERQKIARNGYEKTRALHTYETRISQMIRIIFKTI